MHPADLPRVDAEIARCRDRREPFSNEFRVVLPDGSVRWINGRGEFVFSPQGAPVRMRGVALEITRERRLTEDLRAQSSRLRRVIDVAPVPFALNDQLGNITYLDPAFVETFGYTREDIPTLESWWPRAYPDPDGEQAFREMRRIRPDVKVILASGYNEQEAMEPFIGKGLAGFLQKPYSMNEMRTRIREALAPASR